MEALHAEEQGVGRWRVESQVQRSEQGIASLWPLAGPLATLYLVSAAPWLYPVKGASAYVVDDTPSLPLLVVQVVVVAEDGVTSSRYPLAVTRLPPPPTMMAASLSSSGGSGGDGGSSGESDNGSSSDAPEREVKYESPVSHEEQRQKGGQGVCECGSGVTSPA